MNDVLLAAVAPARASEAPGRLTSWAAVPSVEAFDAAAGEAGFVVALDDVRLRHWLQEIDEGRAAQSVLEAVELERDRWRELAELRASELTGTRALLAEVRTDRARLRLEVRALDRRAAKRPMVRRAWLVAGVAAGVFATLEIAGR